MQRQRNSSSHSSTPYTRKRTHLKPSQVAVLQESFVTNALPDATMRSHLARELEVSERTIQIWFQNRRAKARKSDAYSVAHDMSSLVPNVRTGWIEPPPLKSPPRQATFRSLMTPEKYEENTDRPYHHHHQQCRQPQPQLQQTYQHQQQSYQLDCRPRASSSRPEKHHDVISGLPARAMSEGTDRQILQISIPVNALRIGTWARFMSLTPQNEWDLICYCHPLERTLVWQVEDGGHKFRIELDMDQVSQIRLGQLSLDASGSTTSTIGQLEVDVHHVRFGMCRSVNDGWVRCGDFSENKQASVETMHVLQGNYDVLKHAMLDIAATVSEFSPKLVLPPPSLDVGGDDSPSSTPESSSPSHVTADMKANMMHLSSTTTATSSQDNNDRKQHQQLQHQHQHQFHHDGGLLPITTSTPTSASASAITTTSTATTSAAAIATNLTQFDPNNTTSMTVPVTATTSSNFDNMMTSAPSWFLDPSAFSGLYQPTRPLDDKMQQVYMQFLNQRQQPQALQHHSLHHHHSNPQEQERLHQLQFM